MPSPADQIQRHRQARSVRRSLLWIWPVLISLAAAIRAVPLVANGVWFDELYSIKIATFGLRDIAWWVRYDTHPPLYYQLLHVAMRAAELLGGGPLISTDWLRLTSILPSLAVCFILGGWAWRASGRVAGLTVFALAAFNPGLCFYALELRNYAQTMMFVALATLSLVMLLRRPGPLWMLMFAAASLGHLYTHSLTTLVLAAHGLWVLAQAIPPRRPGGIRLRVYVYGAFALVAAIYLPQLAHVWDQFVHQYKPVEELLEDPSWGDLLLLLFYAYPASPMMTQSWWTPYGIVMSYLYIVLGVLLARELIRARRPWPRGSLARESVAASLFVLAFFILVTWWLTLAGVGEFFSAQRLAMVVLPLWLLAVGLLIERIGRGRARRLGRVFVVGLFIPAAIMALIEKAAYRTDFLPLARYNRELHEAEGARLPRTALLADERLAPWIRRPHPLVRLRGLDENLAQPRIPLVTEVATLASISGRIQTDRDHVEEIWLRHIAQNYGVRVPVVSSTALYVIPPDQWGNFVDGLEALWEKLRGPVVREPDRLNLLPHCEEFNNTHGFHEVELEDNGAFRWTRGPFQRIQFRAPERPGRYRLSLHFYRPAPYPSATMPIDYCFTGDGMFKQMTAGVGSVTVEDVVETTTSRQPMVLELFTDYFVPAIFQENTNDRRELGMMFLRLTMTPADVP